MFWLIDAFESIRDFMNLGGPVLTLIALTIFLMWVLIVERILYFRTSMRAMSREIKDTWEGRPERRSWNARRIRDAMISRVSNKIEQNLPLIKTLLALAPLLGLLDTVTGMIEVFEVMAISGSGNPRSMASGVSKATVPTMAGMVAALSGVAMSAYLENKARRERDLISDELIIEHG